MGWNSRRQDLPPPIRGGAQFGQVGQIGQASGPSLGEMLSQRGFEMPKMKTGIEAAIMTMYKDPITGKMKSGGPNAASHAKAMSDFYGKNPDALNIAKQHQQDQQYNPGGGRDRFNASQIMTGGPSGRERGSMGVQTNMQDFNRPSNMVKPNPYSAPPQMGGGFGGQMGGGMGGGQGMGQFMQFMQQMMQMFQQIQGGGGRGMGGGFQGPSQFMPQQQQYGQYQPQRNQYQQNQFMPQQQQFGQRMAPTARLMTQGPASMMQPQRMSNQFNPNNAFGGY